MNNKLTPAMVLLLFEQCRSWGIKQGFETGGMFSHSLGADMEARGFAKRLGTYGTVQQWKLTDAGLKRWFELAHILDLTKHRNQRR